MKKKTVAGSVAALVVGLSVCAYQLGRYQSEHTSPSHPSQLQEEKKGQKQEAAHPHDHSSKDVTDEEEAHGEQIVVKIMEKGYVTSHGDHYHYYDGKVPFDAVVSEDLLMPDPGYVLEEGHIVYPIKGGYVIKVEGRFYVYLNDSTKRESVRSKAQMEQQAGRKRGAISASQSSSRGYQTDDGYVFRPADVVEDTGDGFVVPHGGHFHFIPKTDLSASERQAAQAALAAKANQSSLGSGERPASPSSFSLATHKADDGFVFDPKDVVKRTATGLVVAHGDHYHFVPYNQLPQLAGTFTEPALQGKTSPQSTPLVQVLPKGEGASEQRHEEAVHTHSHHEQDHHSPVFDAKQVIGADGEGYIISHGDHTHYIYRKDLTAAEIALADAVLGGKTETGQPDAAPQAIALSWDDFSKAVPETEQIAYIAATYRIPLEAIKSSGDYFVFNNPDHAYDPTHIHPYAVRKQHVRVPLVTGDASVDLLNELYTTALRAGVSPYRLKIEGTTFVIPHDGHNHYIAIQTASIEEALRHRLPALQSPYVAGTYEGPAVRAKIDALLAASHQRHGSQSAQHRQIVFALESFWETVSRLASNSTAGYLAALEGFDQQYIQQAVDFVAPQETATDKVYRRLVAQVEGVSFEGLSMSKADFLARIQAASLKQDAEDLEQAATLLDRLEKLDKQPGVAGTDLLRELYEDYRDPRLSADTRSRVEEMIVTLYKNQVEKWNGAVLRASYLDALAVRDQMKKELTGTTPSTQTSITRLDREEVHGVSYASRISRFLDEVYGIDQIKQDEETRRVKQYVKERSQEVRKIRNRPVRKHLEAQLEQYLARAYDSQSDKALLLLELEQLPHYIQSLQTDPSRLERKNTDITYSEEERVAAQEQGRYTTDAGYIFDPRDIEGDSGEAYTLSYLGKPLTILKSSLSEKEQQLAAFYAAQKGLLAPATTEEVASPTASQEVPAAFVSPTPSEESQTPPLEEGQPSTPQAEEQPLEEMTPPAPTAEEEATLTLLEEQAKAYGVTTPEFISALVDFLSSHSLSLSQIRFRPSEQAIAFDDETGQERVLPLSF